MAVQALLFDVFGTVVDWRGSLIRELTRFGAARGLDADWAAFADAWRGLYQPAMERVRRGELGWTRLDELHRMNLDQLLEETGLQGLTETERDHLNRIWHRLDPWPDAVGGLHRLRRRFVVAPLSNGNVSLIVDMARRAALPWDLVLGAEIARHYKPRPEVYLNAAALLDLAPAQCLMVAAHNDDLIAAAGWGLATAFVVRPQEHGPGQRSDLEPEQRFDYHARDFHELADQLGCP